MKEILEQRIQMSLKSIKQHRLLIDTAFIRRDYNISPALRFSKQHVVGNNREWIFSNLPITEPSQGVNLGDFKG